MSSLRILVVGNYPADQQQSMIRFAELLVSIYQSQAEVRLVKPQVLVAGFPALPRVARKYLAYIDKLLLFPIWLTWIARSYHLVHIADHSNSFYAFCCASRRCIVTCHDLLAVRGAMGDPAVACDPSPIGIWLQRLILAGLRRPYAVAFDSQASLDDFHRLGGGRSGQRHAVILIPLNAPFTASSSSFHLSTEEAALLPAKPFLLMVGSGHPRKNRALALRLLQQLGPSSPYRLVFSGDPLSVQEQSFINAYKCDKQVVSIVRPSHALLNHLYCRAHALLFPSHAEGFGWPLIEAQACGCPVIASTTTSIPEVAGSAALYAEPNDVSAFTRHVRALEDPVLRRRLINQGFENLRRFDHQLICQQYINFALGSA